MITEDYVSFETAKLLKEKGFGGNCFSMYVTPKPHLGMGNPNEAKIAPHGRDSHYYEGYEYQCEAPTLQMAMKWLREVHGLHFWIAHKLKQNKGLPWYYEIHNIETGTVVKIGDVVCGSYEVACEEAIKYCLKKLI